MRSLSDTYDKKKCIKYTRNQKSNHTSYCLLHKQPWWSELWNGRGWASILVNWGNFLPNYKLLLSHFSKFSKQRNFLENVKNFGWIFYVIRALNKKFSQSLWHSPRNSCAWKNLKICSVIVYSFVRYILNLQVYRLTSVASTALNVKGVYEVSNSWYG